MAEFVALQPRPAPRTPTVLMHESGDHPELQADRLARSVAAQGIHPGAVGRPNPDQFRPVGRLCGREVPAPESVTRTLARSGSPLDPSVRGRLEPQLGADLSRVRVHTGDPAAQSTRDVQARAYTVGRDVVFGTGQYAPGTPDGDRLLAHELAHVTQQEAAGRADWPAHLQRFSLSDVLEVGAEVVAGPLARDLVHTQKQFIDDVMASVRESPSHVLEFFSDEVWVQIKEHWLRLTLVTSGLVLTELGIGTLTAAPDPSFLTKLAAVILQIVVIAVLGFFAAVEIKGAYEEGVRWLSAAHQAKGDPAKITEASKAFVRMVWHVVMAVMVLVGIRARIRGFAVPAGAAAGAPAGGPAGGPGGPPPDNVVDIASHPAFRPKTSLPAGAPGPQASGFGPGGTALKIQPDIEPVPAPVQPAPPPPVTKPVFATGTGVKPGPGVQVLPAVAAGLPSPQPAPKKKPRPPFVLKVPREKAIHANRYRMWLGRLVSDPAYDRDDDPPAQLRRWHQAHRLGGSHPIPFEVLDRGHRLGLSGEQGEKRIRVPDWSRQAPMKMEVDHVIELQVAPPGQRGEFDSMANYELLDRATNGRVGPKIRANIAAERAKQIAYDPSAATRILAFDRIDVEDGSPLGERWISDELIEGAQLDAYDALGRPPAID